MMIWQDAEMAQAKNRTDAYDGDHNTVSPYDAMEQHKYEKFVDKKADNKKTWSAPDAGKQYSAIQVNSTTNATLVSNLTSFKNVSTNTSTWPENWTTNFAAQKNVTGNATLF